MGIVSQTKVHLRQDPSETASVPGATSARSRLHATPPSPAESSVQGNSGYKIIEEFLPEAAL
jgi:hypothetical protein